MNRVIALTAGAAALAALAAGCSSSTSNKVSTSPPPSTSGSAPATTMGLHAASSKYGQILVDGSGRTLYLLTADTGSKSTCNGTCVAVWPPDHMTGTAANSGLTASWVGTTMRSDHTTQVTYKGHPLYTFAQDSKSGDVNGEGIASFGGTWYVVGVDGNAVTSVPATAPTTPTSPAPSSPSGGGYGY